MKKEFWVKFSKETSSHGFKGNRSLQSHRTTQEQSAKVRNFWALVEQWKIIKNTFLERELSVVWGEIHYREKPQRGLSREEG